MTAPELHTSRLRLQPLQPHDCKPLHRHWSHPEVRRYLWDGKIISPVQVREMIHTSEQLFQQHGVGLWSLRPHASSELMRCAGYWYFHQPPQLELLYRISRGQWQSQQDGTAWDQSPARRLGA